MGEDPGLRVAAWRMTRGKACSRHGSLLLSRLLLLLWLLLILFLVLGSFLFDHRWSRNQLKQDQKQQDYDYRQSANYHRQSSTTHFFSFDFSLPLRIVVETKRAGAPRDRTPALTNLANNGATQ